MITFELTIDGDYFLPKKFQEDTGFVFSQFYEIEDRTAFAKILPKDDEYLLDFLNRLKENKLYFSSENIKKYGIELIILDIKSTSLKFNFSIKDIKALAQLSFIDEIVMQEKERTKKYTLYHRENKLYEDNIRFLKNRLKKAREMCELSYEQVAKHGFISVKQLKNLEDTEKIQKIDFFLVKELAKIYGNIPLTFFYKEDNFY